MRRNKRFKPILKLDDINKHNTKDLLNASNQAELVAQSGIYEVFDCRGTKKALEKIADILGGREKALIVTDLIKKGNKAMVVDCLWLAYSGKATLALMLINELLFVKKVAVTNKKDRKKGLGSAILKELLALKRDVYGMVQEDDGLLQKRLRLFKRLGATEVDLDLPIKAVFVKYTSL